MRYYVETLKASDYFEVEADTRNEARKEAVRIGKEKGIRVFGVKVKKDSLDTLTIY